MHLLLEKVGRDVAITCILAQSLRDLVLLSVFLRDLDRVDFDGERAAVVQTRHLCGWTRWLFVTLDLVGIRHAERPVLLIHREGLVHL